MRKFSISSKTRKGKAKKLLKAFLAEIDFDKANFTKVNYEKGPFRYFATLLVSYEKNLLLFFDRCYSHYIYFSDNTLKYNSRDKNRSVDFDVTIVDLDDIKFVFGDVRLVHDKSQVWSDATLHSFGVTRAAGILSIKCKSTNDAIFSITCEHSNERDSILNNYKSGETLYEEEKWFIENVRRDFEKESSELSLLFKIRPDIEQPSKKCKECDTELVDRYNSVFCIKCRTVSPLKN